MVYFSGFFSQTGVFAGFSLYISPEGSAKDGAGNVIFFRVPNSSFSVRLSSAGCGVAQKGAAQLRGCSVSQIGHSVAQKGPVAQKGQLS